MAVGCSVAASAREASRTGYSAERKSREESFPALIHSMSGSCAAASAVRVGHWCMKRLKFSGPVSFAIVMVGVPSTP